MFKIVALFILYLGSLLASNDGLVVNGVDLRTGKLTANLPALNYQFDDLGRVAVITDGSFETLFIYDSLATTVDYNDSKKDIYTFNDTGLLKTISQFVKNEGEDWLYYRGERVYWSSDESPRIKARLLQSSLNGYEVGYFFSYNSDGSLSEEKIAGNLSGESKQLIEVDEDGQFLENGAEFYTVSYSYDQQNPSLITQKKELDGYSIDYEYDFSGKFCTLKTFGSQHHSIFSYRYFFHDQGMLAKIVEESRENGAHYEKILEVDETFLSDSIAKSQTAKKVTTSSLPFGLSQQSLEDQHGNLMVHNFDALGRLIEIVKPAVIDASGIVYHPTYHFSYNYLDQLVSSTDPKQQTTRYEYNIRGELTKVYYPDGTFENCTYYLNGLVKSRRLRDGTAENFYYDDCRRLTQQLKFSSQNQLLENITFEYSGNLKLKQTVAGTNCTVYLYDEKGALIGYEVYDAAGALVLKDGATNLEQEERQGLPAQNMTDSIVVDETGQSVLQQLLLTNDGCQKVFLYDSRQNIVKEELLSPSGELIFQKRNLYDENGLKIAEINAKIIDGQLDSYYKIDWEYDAAANLTSVSEGGSCLQYIYDDLGRLSQLVQPSGVSINYIYNDLDKISQIYSSDETVNYLYEYEADGQIMLVTDLVNQKSQIYQYDCLHRLVEFKDDDMVVAQQYDLDGNLIKLGLPDGSQITYEYVDQRLTLLSRLSATQTELYRQTYQYLGSSNLPSSYEMINELGAVDLKYLGKKLVETTSSWFSQKMQLERGLKPKIEAISTSFSGRHNSIFPKFCLGFFPENFAV